MSRWQPNARDRLEHAALELFVEQGFGETTVPQITSRAGLTTRTFFRHFADKREVLFAVEAELPAVVEQLLADAPAAWGPMELIERGLEIVAVTRLQPNLEHLRTRRQVIDADEGLRERDLRKLSVLSDAVHRGLLERGLDELTAALSAQVAVTVFSVSLGRWLDQAADRPLTEVLHETLVALRLLVRDARSPHGS